MKAKKSVILTFLVVAMLVVAAASISFAAERKVVTITSAPTDINIDGNLNEWPTAALISFEPRNAGRSSGVLYFMYDQDNLYIAGEVKDGSPALNNQTGGNVYKGDGIEVFINTDPNADPNRNSMGPDDRQFDINPGTQSTWCWQNNAAIEGAEVVFKKTDFGETETGYVVEAKIPLKSLNPKFAFVPGNQISFAAAIDFSNDDGTDRDVQATWNHGPDAPLFAYPNLWGTAIVK